MARHPLALLAILAAAAACCWCCARAAPSCPQVTQMITPCLAYLSGRAFVPYGPCCMGVAALNRTAPTYVDRVAVCSCLKGIAPRLPGVDLNRASILPRTCGVDINMTISPTIDCNTVPTP